MLLTKEQRPERQWLPVMQNEPDEPETTKGLETPRGAIWPPPSDGAGLASPPLGAHALVKRLSERVHRPDWQASSPFRGGQGHPSSNFPVSNVQTPIMQTEVTLCVQSSSVSQKKQELGGAFPPPLLPGSPPHSSGRPPDCKPQRFCSQLFETQSLSSLHV